MSQDFDKSDRLLKKQIFSLNRHIPKQRRNLEDLLQDERPHVVGADGSRHRFKRSELKDLSNLISSEDYLKLKLPIYIEIESQTSGARISGKLETHIVSSILEKDNESDEIFIYRPEIQVLRKKLPTTTQYMFLVR
jgi:uncharacterized protein (UPF0216 family)